MKTRVLFFGQLTDITQISEMVIDDVTDVNSLTEKLILLFPSLATSKYLIALNNKVVVDNLLIPENSKVVLMPPFSGG